MAAITQLRGMFPFTGMRYGSFAGKVGDEPMDAPDFMRGALDIFPHLDGDVRMVLAVSGRIKVHHALNGTVETNP